MNPALLKWSEEEPKPLIDMALLCQRYGYHKQAAGFIARHFGWSVRKARVYLMIIRIRDKARRLLFGYKYRKW